MTSPPAAVRQPKQARSREGWERVLHVGQQLLEEGGLDALTITEVCRRSNVSPPSLYARVDGKAGLFAAVYQRGMDQVQATEVRVFNGLPRRGATLEQQARDAASAIAEVFQTHAAFLRPVIGYAGVDPDLLSRGATESRRLLDRVIAAIRVDATAGEDIARSLYSECVLRTMYGADFFTGTGTGPPETEKAFRARITRTAAARTATGSPT